MMKDYLTSIEKLRKDATECALIRDLATDEEKRKIYDRLSRHFLQLADEVQRTLNASKAR
jgi:hypothetical protein